MYNANQQNPLFLTEKDRLKKIARSDRRTTEQGLSLSEEI